MVGFKNKLPFFLSGSTAGLDAPQAGAVFVGHGWNRTAAAPTSEGREGWQLAGELRSWHWPDTSKKDQNEINIPTAHIFFICLFHVGIFFLQLWFYANTQIEAVMVPQYQSLFIVSKLKYTEQYKIKQNIFILYIYNIKWFCSEHLKSTIVK